jgi:hypothetical protein
MAQTLNISMTPGLPMPVFNVSQYDTGQSLTANLQDYTIPSESTITILGTKPSGFGFSVACTYEGSSVTIPVQSTMTEEAGRIPVELRVVKGNKIRGSANFILKVEESPHKENVTDGDAVTAATLSDRITALEAQTVTATGVTDGYILTADGNGGTSWEEPKEFIESSEIEEVLQG